MLYVVLCSISVAFIVFAVSNTALHFAVEKVSGYHSAIVLGGRASEDRFELLHDRVFQITLLISIVSGVLLTWDSPGDIGKSVLVCIGLGLGALKIYRFMKNYSQTKQWEQQVDKLFLGMDLYLKAGIPMRNALTQAKRLTPMLSDAIDVSLKQWSAGSGTALNTLGRELKLGKHDTRVRFLKEIDDMGIKNLQGLLRRETIRIQEYRRTQEEVRIGMKPLIITVYRTLPVLTNIGMLVGVLAMYAVGSIQTAIGAM